MAKNKSVGWGFGRCNMNCRHCYNASGNISPQHGFEELKKIADRICSKTDSINYGTGELGFNMCAISLAEYIREKYPHIKQSLTTNGVTIKFLDGNSQLKNIFHDVDFSIDLPDPERHNRFRNHPEAWKWAIKGLEMCQEEGVEASIVTCVTGLTTDNDIKELLDIARKYGVSWRINWFRPTGRGKNEEILKLKSTRVWEVLKLLSEITEIEALSDPLFDAVLETGYNDYNGCACGINSCRIQTDMTVTPCVFLKGNNWSGGLIVENSFEEIFESETFKKFRAREPKYCLGCQYWKKCRGGCASRAVLYRGDLNEPDGFCPSINGVSPSIINSIKSSIKIKKSTEKKVHDGYLCTLILKP